MDNHQEMDIGALLSGAAQGLLTRPHGPSEDCLSTAQVLEYMTNQEPYAAHVNRCGYCSELITRSKNVLEALDRRQE